jgi:hypothetical protein
MASTRRKKFAKFRWPGGAARQRLDLGSGFPFVKGGVQHILWDVSASISGKTSAEEREELSDLIG